MSKKTFLAVASLNLDVHVRSCSSSGEELGWRAVLARLDLAAKLLPSLSTLSFTKNGFSNLHIAVRLTLPIFKQFETVDLTDLSLRPEEIFQVFMIAREAIQHGKLKSLILTGNSLASVSLEQLVILNDLERVSLRNTKLRSEKVFALLLAAVQEGTNLQWLDCEENHCDIDHNPKLYLRAKEKIKTINMYSARNRIKWNLRDRDPW